MPPPYPAFLFDGPFPGGACRADFETLPTISDYEFDYIVLPETAGDEGLAAAMGWVWNLSGVALASPVISTFFGIETATVRQKPELVSTEATALEIMFYPIEMGGIGIPFGFTPSLVGTSRVVSGEMLNSLIAGTQASPSPPARACALIREFPVLWRASMNFNGIGDIQETYDCWIFLHYHTGTSRWRIYYSFSFVFISDDSNGYFLQNPAIAPPASTTYFGSVTNSVGMEFDIYEGDSNSDPISLVQGAPEPLFWS